MLYVLFGRDAPDRQGLRAEARSEHLARLGALRDAGRLILAGPHPAIDGPDAGPAGMTGSLIVAEFESIDAAERWLRDDPYVVRGIFERTEVLPFLKVLP